ncbi:hypothetical protein HWV01_16370 [Moritella sp. 5]|uniref:hypothetical protein n=1 Tax=Moritella sp. 5 TaxID=2746231 RepID=UPI001BAC5059|nr:hypothetical protein [Moritella sp. 5]QUM81748.1 hypothetical protein HWV01_16370 [Moritella sp. 5]
MKKISLLATTVLLTACGGGDSADPTPAPAPTPTLISAVTYDFNKPFNTVFPTEFKIAKDAGYDYFIQLPLTSNKSKAITILATNESDEDLRYAIGILISFLTETGENTELTKQAVAESIADRGAALNLAATEGKVGDLTQKIIDELKATGDHRLSGIDEDSYIPILVGNSDLLQKYDWIVRAQSLGYDETIYPGEAPFFTGYGKGQVRDASVEEILHFVQAHGISPLTSNGNYGGLQKRIIDHALSIYKDWKFNPITGLYIYDDKDASNDYINKSSIWSPEGNGATNDQKRKAQWDDDWGGDDIPKNIPSEHVMGQTFSHEYFAAVADAYYGMYEGFRDEYEGMDNYRYITRETLPSDANGFVFANEFLPKFHEFTVRLDSVGINKNLSTNEFKLVRSDDANEKYTFKSQYFKNVKIVGNEALNILGNAQDNQIEGNSADNVIDGGQGNDTYKVSGVSGSYTTNTSSSGHTTISGSDIGSDKLINIENILFSDKNIKI